MSNTALTLVWETSEQDGSRLLILLAVADSINRETGSTFLSLDYLAKKARVSRRTLLDQLGPLEGCNELAIAHGAGPRGCNVYSLGTFYKWGANFAPPTEVAEDAPEVLPVSGGGAEFARVQSGYAVSHPYRIVPSSSEGGPEEEVLTGMGAKSARDLAPLAAPQNLWVATLGQLQPQFRKQDFETWLRDTQVVSETDGEIVVGTANSHALAWLQDRAREPAKAAIEKMAGRPMSVRFVVLERVEVAR
jgi:hypothetical protein